MNPVAYRLAPKESLKFLLIGSMASYRDGRHPERIWSLNIYSSVKSRQIAAKKMKRGGSDIIFIEWDITMEQIVEQGKMAFPIASDKVLLADKMDILRQLNRSR